MNRFNLPNMGYGLGLRTAHYKDILDIFPKNVDWFEIISENFMDSDGRPRTVLEQVSNNYPIMMHGVSLSIGSTDELNMEYLTNLKKLADRIKPKWISDHLCWTGMSHSNTHDLLPVPYTEEALNHIVQRIKKVQDFLGRPILLENPSTYLEFKDSSMREWEFMARMAEEADCALLLDVNNIYVSCYNHRADTKTYIDALPLDRVVQIHLAGHENHGTHIIDTHSDYVIDEVWQMYRYVIAKAGREITTMVEWDDKIPEFSVVAEELDKARKHAKDSLNNKDENHNLPDFSNDNITSIADINIEQKNDEQPYKQELNIMQTAIITGDGDAAKPDKWIIDKQDFPPEQQLDVYINGYRYRLHDILYDTFPAFREYVGNAKAKSLFFDYINSNAPSSYNIDYYSKKFPKYLKSHANDEFAYEIAMLDESLNALFDAPASKTLIASDLSNISADDLTSAKLNPITALRLLKFNFTVNKYFSEFKKDADTTPKKPTKQQTHLAVYRHNDKMHRLELSAEEYGLLNDLFNKRLTIGKTLEKHNLSLAETQNYFSRWMNNHILSEIELTHESDNEPA